ncbi:hypothetical protein AADG42_07235 [Ammonicoccus fulvus]|uniref:Uncharacterized protein n=1 Tax=Ammonicoccus fulvus TaxID=3138240 RepID=A0ABZ3FM13_9ACTN
MKSDSQDEDVLTIGAVIGGVSAELDAWGLEIAKLEREITRDQREISSPLNLNVIYHLSGPVVKVDFSGIEVMRFSRQRSLLRVDAAVPPDRIENRRAILLELMVEAIDAAEIFARQRGIAEDLTAIRGIIPRS